MTYFEPPAKLPQISFELVLAIRRSKIRVETRLHNANVSGHEYQRLQWIKLAETEQKYLEKLETAAMREQRIDLIKQHTERKN